MWGTRTRQFQAFRLVAGLQHTRSVVWVLPNPLAPRTAFQKSL